MFILLDTRYLSSFENDALKTPEEKKYTLKHSEPLNTLPPAKRKTPPSPTDGIFPSVLNYVMETFILH